MTTTVEAPQPDLRAIKQRQQQTWASGDFGVVAARIVLVAEQLCDSADLHAGWRVLDVATGSGNAAIAAARLGCTAVGVDYVPALLERGRERAAAESLDVELMEGDAEALPFAAASFDAVTSVFGSMFAPDHEQAASELLRVCGPTLKAFAALDGDARDALERDLVSLARRFDRLGCADAIAIPAVYTEAVALTH